uniref:CUB domain-containing protein n=1 Tax=Panagrolaimus sp. JU765 TaxID=591449 RepID=A0AC34RLQ1_9BILA
KNGIGDDSPAFPDFPSLCGDIPVKRLITHGNRAFIRFRSSAPARAKFIISYEQFTSGCGGRATGVSGMVSAPQYPRKDSKTLSCEWTITVGEGNHVKLTFPFIDNLDSADAKGSCSAFAPNFIDVYEGVGSQDLIKRYCAQETGTTPIYSESNALTIKYVQHGGSYHGALFGFLAHFSTNCENIILTDFHGSIQSPGYPGSFETKKKFDCSWTIITAPGSRIALT